MVTVLLINIKRRRNGRLRVRATYANEVIQIQFQKNRFHCDRFLRAQHENVRCLSIRATLAVPFAHVQRCRQSVALWMLRLHIFRLAE